jgi:hypothetical protein
MEVFDLICYLTHFDPHCEVMIQDRSGDTFPLSLKDFAWNGSGSDSIRDERDRSTKLYITLDKEIEG